jgi:hypothetical protein
VVRPSHSHSLSCKHTNESAGLEAMPPRLCYDVHWEDCSLRIEVARIVSRLQCQLKAPNARDAFAKEFFAVHRCEDPIHFGALPCCY